MSAFPVVYDPDRNVISLDGPGGASVMLAFLLKAKFGEAFDREVLFHPELAKLTRALWEKGLTPTLRTQAPFTREHLFRIAEAVVTESSRSGWWKMSTDQRVAHLQDVVAPYRLSPGQVDEVLDDVASQLYRLREIVAAAAGEPS